MGFADALTKAAFPLLPHETAKHRDRRASAFRTCWSSLSSHMQVRRMLPAMDV
jgi:hypothetical protein